MAVDWGSLMPDILCGEYAYLCCLTPQQMIAARDLLRYMEDEEVGKLSQVVCQCAVPGPGPGNGNGNGETPPQPGPPTIMDCIAFFKKEVCDSGKISYIKGFKTVVEIYLLSITSTSGIFPETEAYLRKIVKTCDTLIRGCDAPGSLTLEHIQELCAVLADATYHLEKVPGGTAALDLLLGQLKPVIKMCCKDMWEIQPPGTTPPQLPQQPGYRVVDPTSDLALGGGGQLGTAARREEPMKTMSADINAAFPGGFPGTGGATEQPPFPGSAAVSTAAGGIGGNTGSADAARAAVEEQLARQSNPNSLASCSTSAIEAAVMRALEKVNAGGSGIQINVGAGVPASGQTAAGVGAAQAGGGGLLPDGYGAVAGGILGGAYGGPLGAAAGAQAGSMVEDMLGGFGL